MKYNVTLSYHGSITLAIEADNEQKALEAARNQVYAMSDSEFNEAIDLMENGTDVYEDVPEDKKWVKPRFSCEDILQGAEYDEDPDIHKVNDSMELETCDLVRLEKIIRTRSKEKLKLETCMGVRGEVRVLFKDECYRNASQMPKELLDCYHDGKDPLVLDPDYYVDNNNWFEEFVKICIGKKLIIDESYVVDSAEDNDWKASLATNLRDILNEEQACLATFFKEDDQVRWDDPDGTLADQMSPEELKEYRERTFRILEKREENVLISDDVSQIEVLYSELLLQQE